MKLIILMILAVAATSGIVLSSCSPEPMSYPLNQHNNSSNQLSSGSGSSNGVGNGTGQTDSPNTLAGDWICDSQNCTYQEIQVSETDGSVLLISSDNLNPQKAPVGVASVLKPDPGNPNELLLNDEHYRRKPEPSPSPSSSILS